MNKYTELVKKLKIKSAEKPAKFDASAVYVTTPKAADIKTDNGRDNQIILRLLPDFIHEKDFNGPIECSYHLFKSIKNGSMMRVNCSPESTEAFKTTCPLCIESIRMYKAGDLEGRKQIARITSWYINAYVIHNPFDPKQDGQVRILKFGRKVAPIIEDATTGRYASMLGNRIYDCGPDGCSFIYECNKNGQWVDYSRSYFKVPADSADDIKGLKEADFNKIYESVFDIREKCGLKPNTVEDIKDIIHTHVKGLADHEAEEKPEENDSPCEDNDVPDEQCDGHNGDTANSREEQLNKLLEDL